MLFAVAQVGDRLVGLTLPASVRDLGARSLRMGAVPGDTDPALRHRYLVAVIFGWMLLAVVAWIATIALGLIGGAVLGPAGQHAGSSLGVLLFAVSIGGLIPTFYYYLFAWRADSQAKRTRWSASAADEARIKAAVRRAYPSERVILGLQALAVLYTLWLVTGH